MDVFIASRTSTEVILTQHFQKWELKAVVHLWFCPSGEMKVHKVKKMQNIIATSPCKLHVTCK